MNSLAISFNTFPNAIITLSTCSNVIVNGGSIRIVFALTNVPAQSIFSRNKPFATRKPISVSTNSNASIKPLPRASSVKRGVYGLIVDLSFAKNISPTVRARSQRRSSSKTFIVAIAAAHANGLPPNVVVCKNGLLNIGVHNFSEPIKAP